MYSKRMYDKLATKIEERQSGDIKGRPPPGKIDLINTIKDCRIL